MGQNGGMTFEQAMELYWSFFKVPGWKRGPTASARHGAYVASAGAVTAPVVGVGLGVGLMGLSAVAGGAMVVGGFRRGGADFVEGVQELSGGGKQPASTTAPGSQAAPSAGEKIVHLITEPVRGTVKGAAAVGLGAVVGSATAITGGFGGAYYNVRDGVSEISDAQKARRAESGRGMFSRAMSS